MINILYPKKCPGCGKIIRKSREVFCEKCSKKAVLVKGAICMCCGKLISDKTKEYCKICNFGKPKYLTANRAAYVYDGPVREALYGLKYGGKAYVGKALGRVLYFATNKWVCACGVRYVIPVPVSNSRLKKRGYNQAKVIAKEYVRLYNNHHDEQLKLVEAVVRTKNTLPQKQLGVDIRRKNLKKAFKLNKSVVELEMMHSYVQNQKKILLVDDIFTTGATLDMISKLLLESRVADKVYGITVSVGRDI